MGCNMDEVTMIDEDAHEFRKGIVKSHKLLEAHLKENEEVLFTAFLPSREIGMFLGSVQSPDNSTIKLIGYTTDDRQLIVVTPVMGLSYTVEIVSSNKPKRVGFAVTAD